MNQDDVALLIIMVLSFGLGFYKMNLKIEALEHKVNAQKHEIELLISKTSKRKD